MVGRFVQNQQFGVFQQQPTQLQTGLFTPRHRVNGLVVHAFKAHTVEYGADFYFVVVAVARRNLLVEIFVLCGKSAVFVAPFFCLCEQGFRFTERFDGADIGGEHVAHFFKYGVVGIVSARLRKVADADTVLAEQRTAFGVEFAQNQTDQGGLSFAVCTNQPNPVPFI